MFELIQTHWQERVREVEASVARAADEAGGDPYRYYFQFTLNPYDDIFEPHVPQLAERFETFRELSRRIDARRVIWRYDPIIVSDATPVEYHLEMIATIAASLQGHTRRMVFSFLDFYGKVSRRIWELEKTKGIRVIDITDGSRREEMLQLAAQIKQVGNHSGMEVLSCAELSTWPNSASNTAAASTAV